MVWTNEDIELIEYDMLWVGNGASGAGLAPLIEVVSPTVDTVLAATTTPIVFRVWNRGTLIRRSIISIEFVGMGITEIVHNGDDFTTAYLATSSRTAVTDVTLGDGYEYSVLRNPVWPDGVKMRPFVVNQDGLENA